jgi:tetratricopeptide (TPR) repeat protein
MTEPTGKKKTRPASGDAYNLSGDFRGAVINIKSTIVSNDEVRELENLPPEPGEAPFLGLQYFDEKDAGRFFGREMLVAKIVARLAGSRFLTVIGASGSGKSSVVRAGVIPALRRGERLADGGLPPTDSGQWDIRIFSPSAHPLEALAASLTRDSESVSAAAILRADLEQDSRSLALAARRLLSQNGRKHLLLVIDQFEEIFTQCKQETERKAFLENLLHVANPENPQPVSVLLTLRADFYAQLARHEGLRELVAQHQEFIGAMNREELTRAILQPAALGNWKVQAGLVEVLLDDLGSEPGALPLLSHALLETWKRRRGRVMTVSGYTAAGGVQGAIAQTAETVFRQRLTLAQQPIARMIFIKLAEMGDSSLDTRRRAAFSELITRATDPATIDAVLNILTEARLVTTGTLEPGEVRVVEVAHEALIREWPTLREWLDQNRAGLILHRQLTEDANDWLKLERDSGALLRGARLKQMLAWAGEHADLISLLEVEFLEASQEVAREEAEQARKLARARRAQTILGATAGLLVVAVIVVILAANGVFAPRKMTGTFNIAVAEFGEMGADGVIHSSKTGQQMSAWALDYLRENLKDNPSLQTWPDEGGLFSRARVPLVTAETAEQTASQINASLLLYGYIDRRENPPRLALKFWVAPQAKYRFEDIQGSYSLGAPIRIADLENPGPGIQGELGRQSSALAWVTMGLAQEQLGQNQDALGFFLKAGEAAPNSALAQFFIGRAHLFLSDLQSKERETYWNSAESAFQTAIDLDPRQARAYIGLGGVYFKRGASLLDAALATGQTPDPQAAQWAGKALAAYQQSLDLNPDSAEYGNPVSEVARLALGNAYRLKGAISVAAGDNEAGAESIQKAIDLLEPLVPVFEASAKQHESHRRYLAQAYEYLGLAYQWQGALLEGNQAYGEALEAYQKSLAAFDGCIAQAENALDLVIQTDIVENRCQPYLLQTQGIFNELKGEQ